MGSKYVCHQCGRSFELPSTATNYTCLHCASEFIELLEPRRQRSREARSEAEPHSDPEQETEEDEGADGGGGSFVIHSFPGGILLRGGTIPLPLAPRSNSLSDLSFTEYRQLATLTTHIFLLSDWV